MINKIKKLQNISNGAILVAADVADIYPSISHEAGLNALGEALDNKKNSHVVENILRDNLLKMEEFGLKKQLL